MYQETMYKLRESLARSVRSNNIAEKQKQLNDIRDATEMLRGMGISVTHAFTNTLMDEHAKGQRTELGFLETDYTKQIFDRGHAQARAKRLMRRLYIEDSLGIYVPKGIFHDIQNFQKIHVSFTSMNRERYAREEQKVLAAITLMDTDKIDKAISRMQVFLEPNGDKIRGVRRIGKFGDGCLTNSLVRYGATLEYERTKQKQDNSTYLRFLNSRYDTIRAMIAAERKAK